MGSQATRYSYLTKEAVRKLHVYQVKRGYIDTWWEVFLVFASVDRDELDTDRINEYISYCNVSLKLGLSKQEVLWDLQTG